MSDGDKLQWVQCPECNGLGAWKNNESDAQIMPIYLKDYTAHPKK